MMGPAKHVQRDGVYLQPGAKIVSWGSRTSLITVNGVATTIDAVAYDYGAVYANHTNTHNLSPGEYKAIGINIVQPAGDRLPYRVQAAIGCPQFQNYSGFIMVGFTPAPAEVTMLPEGPELLAVDQQVEKPVFIPFQRTFDGLIVIEPEVSGSPDIDKSITFAVGITADSEITAASILGMLSAQQLGVRPPTMQNAVS